MNTNLDKEIIEVNKILFNRYLELIESIDDESIIDKDYCISFCQTALDVEMREDKHSRWLGFIQGVLFAKGLISIEEERDFSRNLFQDVYKKYEIDQETISI